jgi:hypothetical protein
MSTWTPDSAVNSLHVKPHRASKLAIVETRNRGFIYYQGRNLRLCQIDFQDGSWSDLGEMDGISRRVVGSSIAAIAGNDFKTFNIFSQNAELELQGHHSVDDGDTWWLGMYYGGQLLTLALILIFKFEVDFHSSEHLFAPGAPISVIRMEDILLLWTVNEMNDLLEFRHHTGWDRGTPRADTCRGTAVQAVKWGNSFRIYYQGEDGVNVREVGYDNGSYYPGGLVWNA